MIKDQSLTGRMRHRVHKPLFRRQVMVLQVEVVGTRLFNAGCSVESERARFWRDARPEDMEFKLHDAPDD